MSSFSYEAISESGATVTGAVEAESGAMAENILIAQGYIPIKISPLRNKYDASLWGSIQKRLGKIEPQELILFTKQFRSMLHAGVPITRLLQVLEAQSENKLLKEVIAQITQDVSKGTTLFEALEKHPNVFSSLYRSMVRAGEVSGALPDVLARLVYIIEHETKVRSDIKSALKYPKMVLLTLGGAFFVLLTFVIPKFVTIFAKVGLELPLPTKLAMLLYQFVAGYWYLIIATIMGIIFGLRAYFKTPSGALFRDALLLRLPLFGPLFNKAALSRFASIFAILHASGVPVIAAMDILAGTIGNEAIAKEFQMVRVKMEGGQGIAAPLRAAKYFTPLVVDMIAIGEESGNIEEMLKEITIHYDDEVSYAVKGLSDALGPILIVGLAAVVGFFALAIFLPMWDMTKMVKQ